MKICCMKIAVAVSVEYLHPVISATVSPQFGETLTHSDI